MATHTSLILDGKEYVIIPRDEFEALLEIVEDAEDELAGIRVMNEVNATKARGEYIAMTKGEWARIRAGESPVRVVREHRGLTQKSLSDMSGVAAPEISAIEAGKRRGSVDTLKALARALGCPLDVVAGE
ncbi:helix-turn-helix transcriptional regulator [Asticcacaulis sp.]|jgi:DNA-binding XRE family transcriptional regulator